MNLQKNFGIKKFSRSAYSELFSLWQVLIDKHLPSNFTKMKPLLKYATKNSMELRNEHEKHRNSGNKQISNLY